jgi:hypothetical protein
MRVLVTELTDHDSRRPPTAETIAGSHRFIYNGSRDLGFRYRNEVAQYLITDERGNPSKRSGSYCTHRGMNRRVKRACKRFERELRVIAWTGVTPEDWTEQVRFEVVRAVARLYVTIMRLQPFKYGTDASAFVALCRAYKRVGLPLHPPVVRDRQFQDALDEALRVKGNGGLQLITERLIHFLSEPLDANAVEPI